jgi:DNA-binding NtrC family response regulator
MLLPDNALQISDMAWFSPQIPPMSKCVLIIEDEPSIRDSLSDLFGADGVTTLTAGTLDEAKQFLFGPRAIDLIITDLRLGGDRDGGLQVIAAAGMVHRETPVIVLTAFPDDDNRHASERLHAAHFLEKPVDLGVIASLAARFKIPSALTSDSDSITTEG